MNDRVSDSGQLRHDFNNLLKRNQAKKPGIAKITSKASSGGWDTSKSKANEMAKSNETWGITKENENWDLPKDSDEDGWGSVGKVIEIKKPPKLSKEQVEDEWS